MTDYIIVGSGVSGLSLQKAITDLGKDFLVISDHSQQASHVAGGLINPVMLKTGKPVWNIDEFLEYAKQFYISFNPDSFKSYPIHRVFNSIAEQNKHLSLINTTNQKYVTGDLVKPYHHIQAPHKMSLVEGGGVANIQEILKSEAHSLQSKHQFVNSTFDVTELNFNRDHIDYDSHKAKHIIFAEGAGVVNNLFFSKLPIEGNKGEYLLIESEALQLNAILKNKYFLIPLGNNVYKYGATYARNQFNNKPTEEARKELKTYLDKMVSCPYQIVDQVAGLRPTVKDKKPIYGTHPNYKNLHVFNGMGSRGLLMAPLLAKELLEHIEFGNPLRSEIDLNRFKLA
jgi:glycine/D-amino acid oxidase-like deaminating enzyme